MRFLKPIAATLAVAIGAVSVISTAEARHRDRHYYRHHHNGAGVAAAGIFGLAAGALLGSALSQPRHYRQPPVYYDPPRSRVYRPAPVYYERPEPWTQEWYAYCGDRYRSFNSETGYFLGYDGNYHFCN